MPAPEGFQDEHKSLPPVTLRQVDQAHADVLNGGMSPTATPAQQIEHLNQIAQTSARMSEEQRVQDALDTIELKGPPQQ
jgi:hypothetical protein